MGETRALEAAGTGREGDLVGGDPHLYISGYK
jgi:hypothetical protein